MNRITVNTSHPYDVIIGSDLISAISQYLPAAKTDTAIAVISDTNVWPLYGKSLTETLSAAGFSVVHFIFSAGESSKTMDTYQRILNFLVENHITRSDYLMALGGGVVGDITGFAAATYLRGIPYIQVPPSLLAMVDSSVGGKTAIDLPAGKNMIGAFYQPRCVICDTDTLKTLPQEYFIDGCAEVIKYGILFDEELLSHLESHLMNFDRQFVITRCVELKRNVVTVDEFDIGVRQKLNLGHTLGHSIEKQSDFTISHGCAVAIGTALIAKASAAANLCSTTTRDRICSLLTNFSLPTQTDFTVKNLAEHALSDKKRFGNSINLIMPEAIGHCVIQKTPLEAFESIIEAGLCK